MCSLYTLKIWSHLNRNPSHSPFPQGNSTLQPESFLLGECWDILLLASEEFPSGHKRIPPRRRLCLFFSGGVGHNELIMYALRGTAHRTPIYEGFRFTSDFRKESIDRARAYLSAPRRLAAGGNLRHEVRINPRSGDLLHLSPAAFVKRYPFDISLYATRLSKWIVYFASPYSQTLRQSQCSAIFAEEPVTRSWAIFEK